MLHASAVLEVKQKSSQLLHVRDWLIYRRPLTVQGWKPQWYF